MAKRRGTSKSGYLGCSLASHNGKLRLMWRTAERRETWSTGAADTPDNREQWERVRTLVAALRAQKIDPRPHLDQHYAPTPVSGPPLDGHTVRSFYADWIAERRGNVRPALLYDYKRHMGGYVLTDPIADMKLAALRPLDIGLFQSRLRERTVKRTGKPLSEKTVSCVINGTLRAMCRDAAVQDYITRDLFVGLTWKKWKIPPADPLAPDEWDRVAAWFTTQTFQRHLTWRAHPAFHAYVYFLRWHGARPSEASALTWDNVDIDKSIAYIRASYHFREVGEPKTRAAERSVELHPGMVAILRDLRPLRPAPDQPVFPNLDGNRITPRTFWGTWTRCLQACRIRHRGLYCLKDTFVSYVLATAEESGEVERLTAWLVRQTGVRLDTLKQHYQRWWPRDTDAIAETYRLVDPSNWNPIGTQRTKNPRQTANRKWTMSPSCTT